MSVHMRTNHSRLSNITLENRRQSCFRGLDLMSKTTSRRKNQQTVDLDHIVSRSVDAIEVLSIKFSFVIRTILICLFVFLFAGRLPADWPQFRGPDGQGHSDQEGVPIHWSEEENVSWKSAVPGEGWSSPVITGNQIWMTSSEDEGRSLRAICFDKTSGQLLHNVEVLQTDDPGPHHKTNGYASPTPVLDGKNVYVHFGPRGTVCLDTTGKIIWKNTEFKYKAFQGAASSPILHEDLLILTCDGTDYQFLAALDKRTGQTQWQQPRAHLEAAARKQPIAKMAYSTPLVQSVNGVPQLISSGADHVAAYDLKTGKEIWWMPYDGFSIVCRPSYGNGLFYVVGSVSQDHFCVYAIRPGKGKISEDQVVWQRSKGISHVSSPLLVGKEIFVISNGGVATCVDALTGKEHWHKRLGGNYDASPIEVRSRIYYFSRDGKTTVLSAGKEFKALAINQLDGTFKASPAVDDRALFLRSDTHLYRIEEKR
jgi:outer membrane protein assembly factor BamB